MVHISGLLCCDVIENQSTFQSILVCMYVPMILQKLWFFVFPRRELVYFCSMDDIVHLGENSESPSTQLPVDLDFDPQNGLGEEQVPVSTLPAAPRGGVRVRGRSCTGRSTPASSQSRAAMSHKVRGPNWTEAEMLVLIG